MLLLRPRDQLGAALPTESLWSGKRGSDVYAVLPEASVPSSLAPRGLSKAPISETTSQLLWREGEDEKRG